MARSTAPASRAADDGAPQTARALLCLRELIVGGALPPGERIAELAMVERLSVSRTPIRAALARLQEEGLLETLPTGGYVVRQFSAADIHDAIELRGTMEGMAARLAAERGVPVALLAQSRDCIDRIDELLAAPQLTPARFAAYVEHNARFHGLLADMPGSPLVRRQIERVAALPFASPNGFVMADSLGPLARDRLLLAHDQHRALVDAIERREGARAEALAREHARNAQRNLADALNNRRALQRLPGAGLIRPQP
jgi:GntR family transcriptional regulator, vanillate catabolism transcriptional regulator